MSTSQTHTPPATEEQFKQHLRELGLLSKITPPLANTSARPVHEPEPVPDNAVSERVIRERR